MPDTLRFGGPDPYRRGFSLFCGNVAVGFVFEPRRTSAPWEWTMWVSDSQNTMAGNADSKDAAKAACMAAFREFLDAAGLEVRGDG